MIGSLQGRVYFPYKYITLRLKNDHLYTGINKSCATTREIRLCVALITTSAVPTTMSKKTCNADRIMNNN